MRIQTRLVLYFLILAILPVIILEVFTLNNAKNNIENLVLNSQVAVVKEKIEIIQTHFSRFINDTHLTSEYPPIQGILRSQKTGIDPIDGSTLQEWKIRLQKIFSSMIRSNDLIEQVRYLDVQGNEIVKVVRDDDSKPKILQNEALQNKFSKKYFQSALSVTENSIAISDLNLNREYDKIEIPHKPVIRFTKPIFDLNSQVVSVIAINVNAKKLFKELQDYSAGEIIMVDQNGTFLIHPDETKLYGKDLNTNENYFNEQPEFLENLKHFDERKHFDEKDQEYRIWRKIFFDKNNHSRFWVLISKINAKIISGSNPLTSIKNLENFSFTLILICIIIAFFYSIYFARSLSKPIQNITHVASEITKGHLDTGFKPNQNQKSKNEIVQLEQSIYLMQQKLKRMIAKNQESQERFRKAFEFSGIGIALVSPEGTFVKVNEALCEILGYSMNELLNLDFQNITHPDDLDTDLSFVKKVLSGEINNYNLEKRYKRKNGQYIWANLTVALVRNANDKPMYFISQIQDINERKLAFEEIAEKNEILKFVQDETNDGWWDWDLLNPEEEYLSPEFKALFGYSDDEMPNKASSWKKIIFPEDLAKAEEAFSKHLESNTKYPYRVEVRYKHKNGSTVWVICRGRAFKNAEGKFYRMIGTHTDITALKETEEELIQINKQLEQFAYAASHDLQEPLRKVTSFAELLQDSIGDSLSEEDKQYFHYMTNAADRMKILIQDLLLFSRSGTAELALEQISLQEIVNLAKSNLEETLAERKAIIHCDDLPSIHCSKTLMTQVFQNLIGNAVKFVEKEKIPEVWIKSEKSHSTLTISIKDNGIGIDPKFQDKIFEIFKRLHSRDEYSGTGIGLAICKKIIERHYGKIWIESTPGNGSTFFISLPV